MKRPGLFISRFTILPLLLCAVLSANAADPDPSKYPLRIKVLSAMSGTNSETQVFYGKGEANLLLSPGAQAIDFQYVDCPARVGFLNLTVGYHRYIAAKWKKPGKELEALIPYSEPGKPINPNKISFTKCSFTVVTHDFVFVPRSLNTSNASPPEDPDLVTLSGRQVEHNGGVMGNGTANMHLFTTMSLQDYAENPSIQALIEGNAAPQGTPAQSPAPAK